VPPLPFFIERHCLSYTDAAALVMASSLASSVVQPLFGSLAARLSAPWLLPASLVAAGGGLVLAGLTPLYGVAMAAVAVSGLGVAAFHPEAARLMNFASGERRTTGMSVFSLGGNAGFTLGPLAAMVLLQLGTRGLLWLLVPPVLAATVLTLDAVGCRALARGTARRVTQRSSAPASAGVLLLGVLILFRSAVFTGLNTFLILYWIGRRTDKEAARRPFGVPGDGCYRHADRRLGREPLGTALRARPAGGCRTGGDPGRDNRRHVGDGSPGAAGLALFATTSSMVVLGQDICQAGWASRRV
jgi:FSR family fosmidomycin resistance protein-like MFS transporter